MELKNVVKNLIKSKTVSNKLLSIINTILLKIYSQSKLTTIKDLVDWDLWPDILSTFGKYYRLCRFSSSLYIFDMVPLVYTHSQVRVNNVFMNIEYVNSQV